MKKSGIFFILFFLTSVFAADRLYSKDEVIILAKTGHRKGAIKFNHKAHIESYNAKCIDCHHSGDQQKCSTCHMKKDQSEILKLKDIFHEQCRGCHKKRNGPLACSRCHKQN